MNKIFLYIIFNALFISTYAQTKPLNCEILKIDSLYKNYGMIFTESYDPGIVINNLSSMCKPIMNDIIQAEQVFFKQYNIANQSNTATKNMQIIQNPKKYFHKFYRQYICYIDNEGNKNIIIHLINFRRNFKMRKDFKNKQYCGFIVVFAEKMKMDIYTYRVNLGKAKLFID